MTFIKEATDLCLSKLIQIQKCRIKAVFQDKSKKDLTANLAFSNMTFIKEATDLCLSKLIQIQKRHIKAIF